MWSEDESISTALLAKLLQNMVETTMDLVDALGLRTQNEHVTQAMDVRHSYSLR